MQSSLNDILNFDSKKDSLVESARDYNNTKFLRYKILKNITSGRVSQQEYPNAPELLAPWDEETKKEIKNDVTDFEIFYCHRPEFRDNRYSSYNSYNYGYNSNLHNPTNYFIATNYAGGVLLTTFKQAEDLFGLKISQSLEVEINGIKKQIPNCRDRTTTQSRDYYNNNYKNEPFEFTLDSLKNLLYTYYDSSLSKENIHNLLLGLLKNNFEFCAKTGEGISKNVTRCQQWINELKSDEPILLCYMRSLIEISKKTIDSVKVSSLVNATLDNVHSKDDLVSALKTMWDYTSEKSYYSDDYYRFDATHLIKTLPAWKDKRKTALKSQGNRAFTKLMQEYESLKLDEKEYPLTAEAIKNAELPLSIFFHKSEQYHLVNGNFELWEGMLKKHRNTTLAIAKEAAKRTQYEKDLLSYFYFILYALPDYLKKHTKKKWTCVPKLVNDSEELEPPKADEDGIVRKRSALTPVADNEKGIVTVPYVSLAVPGRQTTYCYAHDFHILQKGFSYAGNVVMKDLEERLNNFDDFGLAYYTLTGSSHGRGYPTFLMIFERKQKETVLHIHRCHPARSKDGDLAPIHDWIKNCYNWVVGNIRRDAIKAQQGDLVFVETDKKIEFTGKVSSYDKHCFAKPVHYAEGPNEKSSNILCYVKLDEATELQHTEHDNKIIPAGVFAIHQARSYENNPKSVWTLRID